MTRRDHAYLDKPLLVLPDGTLIMESDLRRIHIRRHLRLIVETVSFVFIVLFVLAATTLR